MAFGDKVQDKGVWENYSDAFTSVTLDSTPTEGNLLVACCYSSKQPVTEPSGWSSAVYLQNNGNSDDGEISYKVAGVAESTTVTVGIGAAGGAWIVPPGMWDERFSNRRCLHGILSVIYPLTNFRRKPWVLN